ncbi:hypothetical protein H8K90_16670 [Winogradskyella echinorum]|uniref:Uncharacterized protein n=1 Tax=Winogradskyella echinorum TaxID=538189 RepID=A0ABR6Y5K3_9FLAO|nr:hypothetical protein [Winogradskyella echinorum]MBC3848031.1 hypothetical protein [Winogradskyella echinorum]MBC5752379.1 hypothetical protein [Winogradskyella echinorum]
MILKAFKEKSIQKYVNKLLATQNAAVNNNKVKTVAVLLNANEFHEFEVFRVYYKELGLISPKNNIIAFTVDDKLEHNKWNTHYSPKDFGWNGKIKNIELESFINEPYDLLICYYKKEVLQLDLIAAASKANLKVGISKNDERLYDLIIDVDLKDINIFKQELKKYLTILNKL